jgi:hypothetical protein
MVLSIALSASGCAAGIGAVTPEKAGSSSDFGVFIYLANRTFKVHGDRQQCESSLNADEEGGLKGACAMGDTSYQLIVGHAFMGIVKANNVDLAIALYSPSPPQSDYVPVPSGYVRVDSPRGTNVVGLHLLTSSLSSQSKEGGLLLVGIGR